MTCEPSDVRGKAGTGSVLSLDAIGRQEAFLLGPDSFFKFDPKRHTNFTSYQSSIRISKPAPITSQVAGTNPETVLNWPFGQTIVIDNQIKPQSLGDLLKNIYLKCTLPFLEDSVQLGSKYCDQIGRAIIKTISFTVDGIEIEKIYNDWNIIRDQLFTTDEEKVGLQYLINGGQPEGTLPTSNVRSGPIDMYIPMNFFFSNNDSTFFPLCAILNQKIKIQIEFNPVSYFSDTHTRDLYPDTITECSLPYFDLVFDQIVLTPDERLYLQSVNHKLLIETVRKQPTLDIPPGTERIKNYLVPNIPVETFHWFFRRSAVENALTTDASLIFNRYNFSSNTSTDLSVQALYPILSDAKFFINGQSQLGFLEDGAQNRPDTSYYFKYVEAMSANLSCPTRNVYTYSFALDPMHEPLSGAIDFSKLVADKTFIDVSILRSANNDNYIMHMYYTGLITLEFNDGFMKIL
jgi:hypothetical protein